MTRLELLNAFLNERLSAAAQDIFRAVKDTMAEYEREVVRSKEENERLKKLLNAAVQRLLLQPDARSVPEDNETRECDWKGSVDLLGCVKEEPRDIDGDHQDAAEGTCSQVESLQTPRPPPGVTACSRDTVCPPPPSALGIHSGCDRDSRLPAGSLSSPSDSHRDTKTARTQTTDKPAVNFAQFKNVKPPTPRPAHPHPSVQRWHCCKECGKGFSFACQLEVHMRWHTKEKPYSCDVCRKSFTTVSMLKRHHRIHTGEKPFRCHVCGKCFNQSAHLNTHFRLHTRERAGWSHSPPRAGN